MTLLKTLKAKCFDFIPTLTSNLETLAKQVANLEYELKHKNDKLETATERLSDRELEISILQKRLELRSARLKNELAKEKCTGCTKKDGLISTLFEKVNLYESAILGRALVTMILRLGMPEFIILKCPDALSAEMHNNVGKFK